MKIYLATWLAEKEQGRALTKIRNSRRLLSYHFLHEQKVNFEQLQQYVRIGRVNLRPAK